MRDEEETTQILKESATLRGLYHVGESILRPGFVVPHPDNRGGEEVKVARTREITAGLVSYGWDDIEANSNGCSVQEPPDEESRQLVLDAGGVVNFQRHFAETILCRDDMMESDGNDATYGSLAHSHLNVALRNHGAERRGCVCDRSAVAEFKCTCGNARVCDEKGYYSMEKFANLIAGGKLQFCGG